jgi:phospholipid/cholesterol/gamma-HCH transport system substrate-binding protein
MIANLDTFSGALARNSDRLDGIIAGLERMTGGAAAKALATYDLTAPTDFPAAEKVLDVELLVLDTEKILTRTVAGVSSALPDAQWGDTVPKLVQMKIIQAFENAGTLAAVSRPIEGLAGDVQLALDIRRFQLAAGAELAGEVELSAKVLDGKGRIADQRLFHATAPAASADAPAAAAALDRAFGAAAVELVVWMSRTIADRWLSTSAPKGTVRGKTTRG